MKYINNKLKNKTFEDLEYDIMKHINNNSVLKPVYKDILKNNFEIDICKIIENKDLKYDNYNRTSFFFKKDGEGYMDWEIEIRDEGISIANDFVATIILNHSPFKYIKIVKFIIESHEDNIYDRIYKKNIISKIIKKMEKLYNL